MSSISQKQEQALRAFYDANILPLHGKVALDNAAVPEKDGSYYRQRSGDAPKKSDFELNLRDKEQIANAFEAHWAGTPMAGLGKKLLELSEAFKETHQEGEVSQYIYEMF